MYSIVAQCFAQISIFEYCEDSDITDIVHNSKNGALIWPMNTVSDKTGRADVQPSMSIIMSTLREIRCDLAKLSDIPAELESIKLCT